VDVHLVDGTYELFRYHHALPSHITDDGREVAATRGVLGSMVMLLEQGATHVGIATDHVIESFRNDLWPGYKSSAGMPPELMSQFTVLEDVLAAAGFTVFAMVEYEADDAMASAAAVAAADENVARVIICTPDKDLAQCVVDDRVVQMDRRKGAVIGAEGVVEKFGVKPASIPDYLALVGDSADGFPGLPGWGAKSASKVLGHFDHLEGIPAAATDWNLDVRGGAKLAMTLQNEMELAVLFRRIATLERDAPTISEVDELRWTGPTDDLDAALDRIDGENLRSRIDALADERHPG
jgi:5'-3' exonuclease